MEMFILEVIKLNTKRYTILFLSSIILQNI